MGGYKQIMTEKIFDNWNESNYEFISSNTLNYIRLRKPKEEEDKLEFRFPEEEGVLIKTYFEKREDGGRSFPHQTFYEYNPETFNENLENSDKKSITKNIKISLINYIKENNSLGNLILNEKGMLKKNNAVKYEWKFGNYLSFNLQIIPEDLGVDDVSIFINGLHREKANEEVKQESWKLEKAKSSRATCRTCNSKIEKDSIRIGQPSYYQDHLSYKWHHLTCIRKFDAITPLSGLEELSVEEQQKVNQFLFSNTSKQSTIPSSSVEPKTAITEIINIYQDSDGLTAESDIYNQALNSYNLDSKVVKETLSEMEEEGLIYRPDQGKIKLI